MMRRAFGCCKQDWREELTSREEERAISDKDVSRLIRRLRQFFGDRKVAEEIEAYNAALAAARPAYAGYLRQRNPWLEGFKQFRHIERTGGSKRRNLSDDLFTLAGDANKILKLQRGMPKSVKIKYQRHLLGPHHASYLFEIDTAWEFYLRGHEISWHENLGESHPEFKVITEEMSFNVECKKIEGDIGRRIKREAFYYLVDNLLTTLEGTAISGQIELVLNNSLPSEKVDLDALSSELTKPLLKGESAGTHESIGCTMEYNVQRHTQLVLPESAVKQMQQRFLMNIPPQANSLFWSKQTSGGYLSPLMLTCFSISKDKFLTRISDTMRRASNQLDASEPSAIFVYIPEVFSFQGLEQDSSLYHMTNLFFMDDKRRHIASVVYTSDSRFEQTWYGRESTAPALAFNNPNCRFEIAKEFSYTIARK